MSNPSFNFSSDSIPVFSGVCARHSFILCNDGRLYAVGWNRDGQLGLGDNYDRESPQPVGLFNNIPMSSVSCGHQHTIFLTGAKKVYSCGFNGSGQLGLGHYDDMKVPTIVNFFAGLKVHRVVCGGFISFCILRSGDLFAFGSNHKGKIGNGTLENRDVPILVNLPGGVKIKSISSGWSHVAALGRDGRVYTWGDNTFGQLGRENPDWSAVPIPVTISSGKVRKLACGVYHVMALDYCGQIICWGHSSQGELGIGRTTSKKEPIIGEIHSGVRVSDFSAGGAHAFSLISRFENGIVSGEEIWAHGRNLSGELCLGHNRKLDKPECIIKSVLAEGKGTLISIVGGAQHTLLVSTACECYIVGSYGSYSRRFLRLEPQLLATDIQLNFLKDYVKKDLISSIFTEQEIEEEGRNTDAKMVICCERDGYYGYEHVFYVNSKFIEARFGRMLERLETTAKVSDDVIQCVLAYIYGDVVKLGGLRLNDILSLHSLALSISYSCPLAIECRSYLGMPNGPLEGLAEVAENEREGCEVELLEAMEDLFERKDSEGDIVISSSLGVDNETSHYAHKFVLVARRPYFRAMFRGGWSESRVNLIKLHMELGKPFEDYLHLMYTGELPYSIGDRRRILPFVKYFDMGSHEDARIIQICEGSI